MYIWDVADYSSVILLWLMQNTVNILGALVALW